MIRDDFAIFILSHGRADKVHTIKLLERVNYTGKWYIIIDNEDEQAQKYYDNFGKDKVIMFNKEEIAKTFDIMDNFSGRGVITYARNAVYDIARQLNLKYFLEFEDDYTELKSRYFRDDGVFSSMWIGDFDAICEAFINYLETTNIHTIAFAQQGDFIGGANSAIWKNVVSRKAMNTFFIKVDDPVHFYGRFNDDVNMYVSDGSKGKIILTVRDCMLHQLQTQVNTGGITESYKQYDTYVKSFYSIMRCPSCVKLSVIGETQQRFHHQIDWNYAAPKIINQNYKK